MRHIKSLSFLVAASVVGVSVSVPAVAGAATESQSSDVAAAVRSAEVPDPAVEAQDSDRMKDNRTWRQMHVEWDWAMPDGIPATDSQYIPQTPMQAVPGYPLAGNALYGPLPDGTSPTYQVVLNANGTNRKGATTGLLCAWTIDSPTPVEVGASNCTKTQTVLLPEGTWPLSLTVTDRKSGVSKTVTSQIQVLNVLFAISGDSYAAGEGYPPTSGSPGFVTTINGKNYIAFDEPGCDRSRWSGLVRAAAMAEQADPRSNVTMVDVACSGAQILQQTNNPGVSSTGGMLSPKKVIVQGGASSPAPAQLQSSLYSGNPQAPGYFPAQVDQLSAIAQGKTYDVHLMSIGGNDAGLSPIVEDCLAYDTLPLAMNGLYKSLENAFANTLFPGNNTGPWPSGMTLGPSCYTNGQVQADLADLSNPSNITIDCVGNKVAELNPSLTATEIRTAQLLQALTGCQWVPTNNPQQGTPDNAYTDNALWKVADRNLNILAENTARLAPCLSATGGAAACQTQKLVGETPAASLGKVKGQISTGVPATDYTAATPVKVNSIQDVAQAMYPDLTQEPRSADNNAITKACSVQPDPTKPWGGELVVGPGFDPANPATWSFKLGPNPTVNPPESPANQVDNTWLYGHLYEGVKGRPVGVPQPTDFPNNVPLLYAPDDNPQAPYTQADVALALSSILLGSTGDPNPPQNFAWTFVEPVTPTADGLVTQLNSNSAKYGWQAPMSMYDASHPHGLCADGRWETNLADFFIYSELYNGTGYGLHPNNTGYAAYADMLGPVGMDMAGVPVAQPTTTVDPLGDGVATKTKVKLPDRTVKSGKRATVKVRVIGALTAQAAVVPGLKGRIEIQGNKKGTSHWMKKTMAIKANGKKTVKLPRKWTKLVDRKSGNLRLRVRYLGNPTYLASKAKKVKMRIVS